MASFLFLFFSSPFIPSAEKERTCSRRSDIPPILSPPLPFFFWLGVVDGIKVFLSFFFPPSAAAGAKIKGQVVEANSLFLLLLHPPPPNVNGVKRKQFFSSLPFLAGREAIERPLPYAGRPFPSSPLVLDVRRRIRRPSFSFPFFPVPESISARRPAAFSSPFFPFFWRVEVTGSFTPLLAGKTAAPLPCRCSPPPPPLSTRFFRSSPSPPLPPLFVARKAGATRAGASAGLFFPFPPLEQSGEGGPRGASFFSPFFFPVPAAGRRDSVCFFFAAVPLF